MVGGLGHGSIVPFAEGAILQCNDVVAVDARGTPWIEGSDYEGGHLNVPGVGRVRVWVYLDPEGRRDDFSSAFIEALLDLSPADRTLVVCDTKESAE